MASNHGLNICTIVAKNYLAYARCLADSFLSQHPEGQIFVLLVDEMEDDFEPSQERFTTILAREIGIPKFEQMAFRYLVFELSTAVKPFFLEYLVKQYNCQKVCYFDPDIYFYSRVDEIFGLLDSYGIVLLPHLTGFLDDEFEPNELTILRSGAYNLGFIGVAEHPDLDRFLHWWQRKLIRYCTGERDKGLFLDQRWMDLAPSLFPSVYIHRDPGCDVAYWNLPHRHVERTESGYQVNGSPLKFFHFSGFIADNVEAVARYQNRYTLKELKHLESLFFGYRDCLLSHGHNAVRGLRYAYDYFDNGVYIPEFARYLWREVDPDGQRWPDPFKTALKGSFIVWLNEPADNAPAHLPLITNLALETYRRRPDVQQVLRDVLGHDRRAYAEWFVSTARVEHHLDDSFIQPIVDSLQRTGKDHRPVMTKGPVLQPDWGKRFYLRTTNLFMRAGVGPFIQRSLGDEFISDVRDVFFSLHASPLQSPSGATALPDRPKVGSIQALEEGLNVVGYFRDESGVGEAARSVLKALYGQGFPVAYTLLHGHSARKEDNSVLHLPSGNPYNVNLLHVNADQVLAIYNELGPEFFSRKYNIGYWFWELAGFPSEWFDCFNYYDEIWVGTSFGQTALSRVSPIPVVNMGIPVELPASSGVSRRDLGLPENQFLFLSVFDMLSVFERKNPLGLIEAYRRAFEPDFRDTRLVIKVTNLDKFPQYQKSLRSAVESASGVLIDGYMSRPDLAGLFDICDAYVSLHRSEGFGVTIAEAMALGKPAIATDYSANEDFMRLSNSYPVAYRLRELDQDYGPYRKGQVWADPDLDHAASQMKHVFENPEEAARRGTCAARDIRQLYGSEVVARRIIERLRHLELFHA
jgi:glycosyltransferase involved in cell wall biosynthesis